MPKFLDNKHFHIARVVDSASFCGGYASNRRVYLREFKLYSVQRLFHHRFIFNCFKRRLITTALGKTAICEGLLIFTNVFLD